MGPLAFTPTISLKELGVDGNVFNSVDDPKSDLTATIGPAGQFWLRAGRARVAATSSLDVVYFQKYASERAVNSAASVKVELPFVHVTPYVASSLQSLRDRPGYEIDARARHNERTIQVGAAVPLGSRLALDVSQRHTRYRFTGDAVFEGTFLAETLNRATDGVNATLTYSVTPLTRVLVVTEATSDRFEFSSSRDNRSIRVTPGVTFNPFALINGSAFVGIRTLDSRSGDLAKFRGTVALIDLGYTLRSNTHFAVNVERDIRYSFEIERPYYVLSSWTASVTQRVVGAWEVKGSLTGGGLAYQARVNSPLAERRDTLRIYGGGVGYRLREGVRIGVDATYYRRRSDVLRRAYEAFRVGSAVTYGF